MDKLEDYDRLLLFFYVLKHGTEDREDQMKKFCQISGLTPNEAQIALDKCVLEGFVL